MARSWRKSGWFGKANVPLALFCVLLACAGSSSADVGETITQLETRLGTCVDSTKFQRLYRDKVDLCLITHRDEIITAEDRFAPAAPELRRRRFFMPKPPFPNHARPFADGIGLYKIGFDAAGRPSAVDVIQPANPVLDQWTKDFVSQNWKGGPADSSVTLAIAYHHDSFTEMYGAR